jgi:proteasome alpha subunit
VTLPIYASPEQLMRERSELARKGIARGRSVVALKYSGGILFVAENPSAVLHKVSEIYDRIGFAAAGRYSEYEALRRAGIRHVDMWGYSYDRRDVSVRQLANVYSQALGAIFTDQLKPYEVEICVGEVGGAAAEDQLFRLTFDGSIVDEPQHLVMGGQTDPISTVLKNDYREDMALADAVQLAVRALSASAPSASSTPNANSANGDAGPVVGKLEVAVLERSRPTRAFRRLEGAALRALLPGETPPAEPDAEGKSPDVQEGEEGGGS